MNILNIKNTSMEVFGYPTVPNISIGESSDIMWKNYNVWLDDYGKYAALVFSIMNKQVINSEKEVPKFKGEETKLANEFMDLKLDFKQGPFTAQLLKDSMHAYNSALKVFGYKREDFIFTVNPTDELNKRLKKVNLKVAYGKPIKLQPLNKDIAYFKTLKTLGYGSAYLDFIEVYGGRKYDLLDNMKIATANQINLLKIKKMIDGSKGDERKNREEEFKLMCLLTQEVAQRMIDFGKFLFEVHKFFKAFLKDNGYLKFK